MQKFIRSLAATVCVAAAMPAHAAGDLLVAPTRVILENGRGTEVYLNNIGTAPATYRISLELRRMSENGFDEIPLDAANPKESAALAMINFSPRRVVLPPNQPQVIRIGIRAPADLPDGEYRAHMLFRAIPDAIAAVAPSDVRPGLSIALQPIYGVTIPIIVRKGALTVTAAVIGAQLTEVEGEPALAITLTRTGEESTYGRIRILKAGVAKPVYEARGVAIYPEVNRRVVMLTQLTPEVRAALPGPATIQYLEDSDTGGGVIAQAQVVIR